jgi:hypothetical protein
MKYTEEHFNLYNNYPKVKAYDLAVIHLFKDHPKKPYKLHTNGKISYYQEYKAISDKGEVLDIEIAFSLIEARDILSEKIKKGSAKYEKWEKSEFCVSYLPLADARYTYIKKRILQDFPEIERGYDYFVDLYNTYNTFFTK